MFAPTIEKVQHLAEKYNLIPIVREVMADMETPIRLFHHIYEEDYAFLLESVEGGAKWARYSFIGTNPFMIVKAKQGKFSIELNGKSTYLEDHDPLERLRSLLGSYKSPHLPDLPRFTGGAVGFFGYDLLQYYEQLPAHRMNDLQMNDLQFMFCDKVIAFDHMKQSIKVIANLHVPERATKSQITKAYHQTCAEINQIIDRLNRPLSMQAMSARSVPDDIEPKEFSSNMSKEQFMSNVERAKEYIQAGEIEQAVLSQRFEMMTEASPLEVYRVLRTMNPSPYMYYLKMGDEVIVGTSPELLVRVEGRRVETRPIAGTRPRGKTSEEDVKLEEELLADPKERAEHDMLVDLGRNDLSRVCEEGSIHCDSYMEIERYSHVMHIVSNLSGKLREDKDFFDAFLACMPAGTVSGSPKLRAMEIIAELENEARGAYAGAIGYLGFSGNLDSCITIRTIIFKNSRAYVQAGAGIVSDSVPEKEYEETVNKAKALLKSICAAENIFVRKPSGNEANQDYYLLEKE